MLQCEITWPYPARVLRDLETLVDLFLPHQRCYFSVAAKQASLVSDILLDHKDRETCFSSGQVGVQEKEV